MTDENGPDLVEKVDRARARWESDGGGGARSSHFSSVSPVPVGKANPWHNGGQGTNVEQPAPSLRVTPPVREKVRARIAEFAPIRIGYLIDIDTGALLGDCLDAVLLACEDALTGGELFRPVEIVPRVARGLPRGEARDTVAGYESLCDDGCLAVLGPYITDNALALLPAMERRGVPLISTNGAKAFHSRYGFTVGNGGVSEEGAMMAGWLRTSGYSRVAMVTEVSPGGAEYASAFKAAAVRNRLDVATEVLIGTNGDGLEAGLTRLRDEVRPDAMAYCGYGYPMAMFNPILEKLGWDLPRIASTAFLWYINEASILNDLEGWVGVDQIGDEIKDPNPNYWPVMRRFEERFGRLILHAMVGCTYDQSRAVLAGVAAAELLTPEGVTHGLETLTMLPSVVGGPRTYISFGPYDHKGLKGDWLTLRRVVDGVPTFEGLLSTLYPQSIQPAPA